MSTATYATCEDCKRKMKPGGSCTFSHVEAKDGTIMERVACGTGGDWADPICHDCNAGAGKYHHPGCDTERCPKCGGQMIGCLGDPDDPELVELAKEFPHFAMSTCGWVSLLQQKRVTPGAGLTS